MEAVKPESLLSEIDDDDDFEDENLKERLIGLTEMFPERFRSATLSAAEMSVTGLKKTYSFSRSALWIMSTSFIVLVMPVLFETEMAQMEQAQIQQQRQILLGPNAAGVTPGVIPGGMTPPLPAVAQATP